MDSVYPKTSFRDARTNEHQRVLAALKDRIVQKLYAAWFPAHLKHRIFIMGLKIPGGAQQDDAFQITFVNDQIYDNLIADVVSSDKVDETQFQFQTYRDKKIRANLQRKMRKPQIVETKKDMLSLAVGDRYYLKGNLYEVVDMKGRLAAKEVEADEDPVCKQVDAPKTELLSTLVEDASEVKFAYRVTGPNVAPVAHQQKGKDKELSRFARVKQYFKERQLERDRSSRVAEASRYLIRADQQHYKVDVNRALIYTARDIANSNQKSPSDFALAHPRFQYYNDPKDARRKMQCAINMDLIEFLAQQIKKGATVKFNSTDRANAAIVQKMLDEQVRKIGGHVSDARPPVAVANKNKQDSVAPKNTTTITIYNEFSIFRPSTWFQNSNSIKALDEFDNN